MSETQHYVLDSSALLHHPEILARAPTKNLVIPEAVRFELSQRGRGTARDGILKLIGQAIARGARIAPSPDKLKEDLLAPDRNAQRLSGTDFDIARVAIDLAERFGASTVALVTHDRDLAAFLSPRGIKTITSIEFLAESSKDTPDADIQSSAKTFLSAQTRHLALSALVSVAFGFLGNVAYSKLPFLVSTFSVWGTVVALPALGVALYWYRQRFRLSYGIFEFLVGVMLTYYVFFPTFSYAALTVVEGIQIIGGLYVMVRGLDNVSKGVEGTRFEQSWKKLFG